MFMNLEGAGAGGREVLFQSGPGNMWILETYLKHAPYPTATVVAQEIFQNNLIPSDTDFRIFRDYGNLSGIDMAYINNAYVYHTEHDSLNNVGIGAMLRCGENVLNVAKELVSYSTKVELTTSSNHLAYLILQAKLDPADQVMDQSEKTPVYFELVGYFAVSYPGWVGVILNLSVCAMGLFVIAKGIAATAKKTDAKEGELWRQLAFALAARAASFLLGVFGAGATAGLLGRSNSTMSWFTSLTLLFFLYVFPSVIAEIVVTKMLAARISVPNPTDLIFKSVQLQFIILTVAGTLLGIRSTFLPMLFVLFPMLGNFFVPQDKVASALFNIFPVASWSYLIVVLIPFFVAIMGRNGVASNPDITIGLACNVLAFAMTSYSAVKITRDRHAGLLAKILFCLWVGSVAAIVAGSVGFPYRDNHQVRKMAILKRFGQIIF
jgi:hypothetical protein